FSVKADLVSLIHDLDLVFIPNAHPQRIGTAVFLECWTVGISQDVVDCSSAMFVCAVRPRSLVNLHFKASIHTHPGLIAVRVSDVRIDPVGHWQPRVTEAHKDPGIVVWGG